MAQGRPPRRSKKDREPVTLDLEAEKTPEASEPEGKPSPDEPSAADDAAPKPEQQTEDSRIAETKGAENAPAEVTEPLPVATETEAEESAGTADKEHAASAEDDRAEATATDTASDEAVWDTTAASDAGGEAPRPRPESSVPQQRKASSAGIAFVAGLIGGIVVGAIGFGLYYGGVLPVPGRDDLQQTRAALSTLGNDVADLKQKVAMLKNAPAPQPDNSNEIDGLKSAVGKLGNEFSALSGQVDKLGKQVTQTSQQTVSKAAVGGLNGDMKSLQGAVGKNGSQIDALSGRVDQLAKKVAQAGNEAALVKAIAASSLSTAIERGGSFRPELKVYRSVAPDDPAGQQLLKLAAAGVPSRQQLLDEFPKAADAILAAVNGSSQSGGVFDRLMSSAESVIKIRPTGNVQGNGPKDVVARMEAKLKEGDLNVVVKEWSSLPETGRNASEAFIGDVRTRIKAEALANEALKRATPTAAGQQG